MMEARDTGYKSVVRSVHFASPPWQSPAPCCAQAKGKGKMLATMQTYALKLAVIFVPLPPPLGVIIEKGAPLGEKTYMALRLNVFGDAVVITRWSPNEEKHSRLD